MKERSEGGKWGWGEVRVVTFFVSEVPNYKSAKLISVEYYYPRCTRRTWVILKNLRRRKCVRIVIFRTAEVRVEGRFVPFNP